MFHMKLRESSNKRRLHLSSMPDYEECLSRLRKLKALEESALERLSVIRIEKMRVWSEMNRSLGDELKPHYSILDSSAQDQLEWDLMKV